LSDTNLRLHGTAPFRAAVIHGGPGAAGEMAPVARRLSRSIGVLEPLQTAMSVEGQVEELRQVLVEHAQIPAVLIGFSWGAWLSLLVAAQYPELAGKLILVSSGPFTESHAAQIHARRLERLDAGEKVEYEAAARGLADSAAADRAELFETLGRLAAKADAYAPVDEVDDHGDVRMDRRIYSAVWEEAKVMRRSGELLRRARLVKCPVVAIHGDADPHPAEGVAEPLSAAVANFHFEMQARCGHKPWLERHAKEEFHRLLLAEVEGWQEMIGVS